MSAQKKGDHGQTDKKMARQDTDETKTEDQPAEAKAAPESADDTASKKSVAEEAASESEAATDGLSADGGQDGPDKDGSDDKPDDDAPPLAGPPMAIAPEQTSQAGSSTMGWAALVVAIIGSVGAASISSWGPSTIGYPKAPNNADEISALEGQVTELTGRIETLNDALVPALEARLADVEGRPVADPNQFSDLNSQIEALAGDVAAQADALTAAAEQSPDDEQTARLDGLTDRIGGLEGGLANIEGRLSAVQSGLDGLETGFVGLESQVGETSQALSSIDTGLKANASAVLIVDSVRAAVEQGRPYADLMPDLAALAEVTPDVAGAVETLGSHADGGLVARNDLLDQFPAAAKQIRASLRAPDDDSLLSKTLAKVTGLVDVRPSGDGAPVEEGGGDGQSDMLAIVLAAEQSIADNDIGSALESLGALDGPAAEAAEPWLTDARNFLAADQALDQLRQAALIRLGQGAG